MSNSEVSVIIEPDVGDFVAALDRALGQMYTRWIGPPKALTASPRRPVKVRSRDPQSLFDVSSHGCWGAHGRLQETTLEQAVRQYNDDHPVIGLDWQKDLP